MSSGVGWNEFWAAGFGAAAAFALEAVRRWRDGARGEQDAANGALLTLSQMFTQLENIRQQVYEEQAQRVKAIMGREPLPIELLPMTGISDYGLRLDFTSLGFLLRTHDPDVLNRIAVAERSFVGNVLNEQQRATLHYQLQQNLSAAGLTGAMAFSIGDAKRVAGESLFKQVEMLTAAQMAEIPKTIDLLLKTQSELVDVVSLHFPTRRFVQFERRPGGDPDRQSQRKASLWRRALRWLCRGIRRIGRGQ